MSAHHCQARASCDKQKRSAFGKFRRGYCKVTVVANQVSLVFIIDNLRSIIYGSMKFLTEKCNVTAY